MRRVYTSASCANRFGHKLNFSQGQFSYHLRPWSISDISRTPSSVKQPLPVPSTICQKNLCSSWMMRVRSVLSSLLSTLRTVLLNMKNSMVALVHRLIVRV